MRGFKMLVDKLLQELNLSLSNICNANCIFCPRSAVKATGKVFMELDLVTKLVDEVTSSDFEKTGHKISHCNIGENGEPTLNKNLLPILREVRRIGCTISMYTNFSKLDENLAYTLISEKLVDNFHTNIDGCDSITYNIVKGLDYQTLSKNVMSFLGIRDLVQDSKTNLFIHVVTAENYKNAVYKHFKGHPTKLGRVGYVKQEAEKIVKTWKVLLRPSDGIAVDDCLMWAERFGKNKIPGQFTCRNIGRVETNIFVNPNGDWYVCCFDVGNELVLGNLYKQSIVEVADSYTRKRTVRLLNQQRFDELGPPCDRVDCCQVVNPY